MNPILHWRKANTSIPEHVQPKMSDGRKYGGLKAQPIVYEGKVYQTWPEAAKATGKTISALRWVIEKRDRECPRKKGHVENN